MALIGALNVNGYKYPNTSKTNIASKGTPFLYHEGAARKVFPCTICQKEFSRPDKMKQHLKQAHDGIPKSSSSSGGGSGGGKGNRGRSLPEDDLPPSTLLINPFRGLSDPADMEGKISSIKESGSRC